MGILIPKIPLWILRYLQVGGGDQSWVQPLPLDGGRLRGKGENSHWEKWDGDPKTSGDTDLVSPRLGDAPGQPHPPAELDHGVNGEIPGFLLAPGALLPGKKGRDAPKKENFGIKRGSGLGISEDPTGMTLPVSWD